MPVNTCFIYQNIGKKLNTLWVTLFEAGPWRYAIATMDDIAYSDITCAISSDDAEYMEISIPEGERARKYYAQFDLNSTFSFASKGITSDERYRYDYRFGYPTNPFYKFLELSVDYYTAAGDVLVITGNLFYPLTSGSFAVSLSYLLSNGSSEIRTMYFTSQYSEIRVGGGRGPVTILSYNPFPNATDVVCTKFPY